MSTNRRIMNRRTETKGVECVDAAWRQKLEKERGDYEMR